MSDRNVDTIKYKKTRLFALEHLIYTLKKYYAQSTVSSKDKEKITLFLGYMHHYYQNLKDDKPEIYDDAYNKEFLEIVAKTCVFLEQELHEPIFSLQDNKKVHLLPEGITIKDMQKSQTSRLYNTQNNSLLTQIRLAFNPSLAQDVIFEKYNLKVLAAYGGEFVRARNKVARTPIKPKAPEKYKEQNRKLFLLSHTPEHMRRQDLASLEKDYPEDTKILDRKSQPDSAKPENPNRP